MTKTETIKKILRWVGFCFGVACLVPLALFILFPIHGFFYDIFYPKIPLMPPAFREKLTGVILLPKPGFGKLTDCLRLPEKCNKLFPRDGKILPIPVSEYTYYRTKGETAPFMFLASPNERYFAYSDPKEDSYIWDTKTNKELILKFEKDYGDNICRFNWSPDNRYVLYTLTTAKGDDSGDQYIHYIMNLETGETYRFFPDITPVWDLYWEEK